MLFNMKEIIYDINKSFLLTESAEELTGKQFIQLAGLLHQEYTTQLQADLAAMRILSGMSKFKFYFLPADVKIRTLERALETMEWVFDKISITKNLLPVYKKYYGPSEELNNMTLAEFHFAEQYYSQLKGENYDALPYLIATIYRQSKPGYNKSLDTDGDVRQKFNSNVVEYHAKKISKWPKAVQYAILIFYDSCRDKIAKDNKEIFSGSGEGDGLGMYSVMRGLAGPKFGEIEKVEEMLLHNALLELNLIREEEKELERMYKK